MSRTIFSKLAITLFSLSFPLICHGVPLLGHEHLGEQKVVVLMVDTSQSPAIANPAQTFTNIFTLQSSVSVASWVKHVSRDNTWLLGSQYHGWIRYPHAIASGGNVLDQTAAGIIQLSDPHINFSGVDKVVILYAVPGCEGYAPRNGFNITTQEGPLNADFIGLSVSSTQSQFNFAVQENNLSYGPRLASLLLWSFGPRTVNILDCGMQSYSHEEMECHTSPVNRSPFDILGDGNYGRQVNTIQREQLRWLSGQESSPLSSPNILPVTQSGTYFITPIAQNTSAVQTLKVHRATCKTLSNNSECAGESEGYYYIEYRTPTAFDVGSWTNPPYPGQYNPGLGMVLVYADSYAQHLYNPQEIALLDMTPGSHSSIYTDINDSELDEGSTFTTPEGVRITTLEETAQGAFIQVLFPEFCPVDANSDNKTNGADLSVLISMFGQTTASGFGADFNSDGIVDGRDLSMLLSDFGCGE